MDDKLFTHPPSLLIGPSQRRDKTFIFWFSHFATLIVKGRDPPTHNRPFDDKRDKVGMDVVPLADYLTLRRKLPQSVQHVLVYFENRKTCDGKSIVANKVRHVQFTELIYSNISKTQIPITRITAGHGNFCFDRYLMDIVKSLERKSEIIALGNLPPLYHQRN